MTAYLGPESIFRAFDSNGAPLAGGLLYTYSAGTTTPKATYTTRAGNVQNANPVVLDANGQAVIYFDAGLYKLLLKSSAGVTQPNYPQDNYTPSGYESVTLAADLADTTDTAKGDALIGVQLNYANTVPRTEHDKNQDLPSVMDWLSTAEKADVRNRAETLDVSTAVQAAVNARDDVYFPAGTYIIGTTITKATGNPRWHGDGDATIIKMKSAANLERLFYGDTGCASFEVSDLTLDGNRDNQSTPTFGGLADATAIPIVRYVRVTAKNSYTDGLDIRTESHGYIEGCHVSNCKLTGSKITGGALDGTPMYSRVINNTFEDCQTSVHLVTRIHDCIVSGNTIIGDSSTTIDGIKTVTQSSTQGIANQISIVGNTVRGMTSQGINVTSDDSTPPAAGLLSISANTVSDCVYGIAATRSDSVSITGNNIFNNSAAGISLGGCSACTINGNALRDNPAIGINIVSNSGVVCDNIIISANSVYNETAGTSVGIKVASSQTNINVIGNPLKNCDTAISGIANINKCYGNAGFVTSNSGTATIPSGSTYVDVTHGLSYTPTLGQIKLTAGELSTSDFGYLYPSAIGATTFRINCVSDPGASNLDVGWSVFRA